MTVLVKFQIEIRFSIELHGNSKLSLTSCPPSSGLRLHRNAKQSDSGHLINLFTSFAVILMGGGGGTGGTPNIGVG